MIDRVVIYVKSGKGGNGAISGRREKFVPAGGPDGGDGGDGGSVVIRSSPNVNTLLSFRYRQKFAAGDGGHGEGRLRHGGKGWDIAILVPVGTQVWGGRGFSRLLVDLANNEQFVVMASGGRGGRGNVRFASSTNRFPLLAEEGEAGVESTLRLELKLLADVGIFGVPNVGKSSLLAAVSAARPKIADYPFTTLEATLGVVQHGDSSFVMVDIPGLVEGAHQGVGLGQDFLRHVERSRVLLHVLDGSSGEPVNDLRQVNEEMRQFGGGLLDKPRIIAVNKVDIPEVRGRIGGLRESLSQEDAPLYFISALTGEGINSLLDGVLEALGNARRSGEAGIRAPVESEVPVLRPRPRRERVKVCCEDGAYVVSAPAAARIAALIDENDWNAQVQFYGQLRRMGVIKVLEDAGIATGDTVRIGKLEWEWE